jgi:hypothetical protein
MGEIEDPALTNAISDYRKKRKVIG